MSAPKGADLPVVAHEWDTPNPNGTWHGHLTYEYPSGGTGYKYRRALTDHAAALSRIRSLQQEVERLRQENARLAEDRARFPDRPDDIGRMISAQYGNLKAVAEANERAWRSAQLNADFAAQELERLRAGIGEVAMRLSKEKSYRLRAAEALLALLPQGSNVAPGGQPSEMSK
jgi:hypothetical protein